MSRARPSLLARLKKMSLGKLELINLVRQLNTAGDREIALVMQAWLEAGLETELKRKMPNLSPEMQSELFGGLGPLASFRAKIVLGFGLGLYGPVTLSDLNLIKEIRNAFAHSPFILDFNEPEIAKLCRRLKKPSDFDGTDSAALPARASYSLTCFHLWLHLDDEDKTCRATLA